MIHHVLSIDSAFQAEYEGSIPLHPLQSFAQAPGEGYMWREVSAAHVFWSDMRGRSPAFSAAPVADICCGGCHRARVSRLRCGPCIWRKAAGLRSITRIDLDGALFGVNLGWAGPPPIEAMQPDWLSLAGLRPCPKWRRSECRRHRRLPGGLQLPDRIVCAGV